MYTISYTVGLSFVAYISEGCFAVFLLCKLRV